MRLGSYCKWTYLDGIRGHGGLGNVADLVESLAPTLPVHVAMPLCTCPPAYVRPALTQSISGLGVLEQPGVSTWIGIAVVAGAAIGFFAWMGALAR